MVDSQKNETDNSIYTFTFPTIWDAFQAFENMATRKRGEKLDTFLRRWKEKMRIAQSAGCDYTDTILACKLLQMANLEQSEVKSMVNSIDFCPSEMLSTIIYSLEDFLIEERESCRNDSVKSELETDHARRIKEEFPEDHLNASKPAGQPEEDLLVKIELKEEVLESSQDFIDFSNSVDDLSEDNISTFEFDFSKSGDKSRKKKSVATINKAPKVIGGGESFRGKSRMSNNGGKRFYCNSCPLSFTQAISLKKHFMRKHTDERPFKCTQCGYSAIRQSELTRHFRRHTGEKPYKCPSCEKAFGEKKSMRYHFERAHSNEPTYICALCAYWTAESSKMTLHMKTHSEKEPLSCSLCEKTFSVKKLLKRHMLVKHGQELVEEEDNLSNPENVRDPVLNDNKNEKGQAKPLKEESEESTKNNDLIAPIEVSDMGIDESQGKKSLKQPKEKKKAERLQCEHCGKELSGVGALKGHYSVCPNLDEDERSRKGSKYVRNKGKYTCEICNKTIVGENSYNHHLSLHSSERNFICDICPATFTSSYYLDLHKYRHKKGKWRHCDSCDKSFSATGELKRHIMRVHTEERPFQCPHCAYNTVAKFYLDRHMRSHTGETPFKCNLCGKMYRDKKSVKRHINAHHGCCDEKYIGRNPAPPIKQDDA